MIAISPPESQWNRVHSVPARTGSLRRIDDIVGELLAGYALEAETGAATSLPSGPFRGMLPTHAGVAPVESLLAANG